MAEHEYHPLYTDRMTFEDQEPWEESEDDEAETMRAVLNAAQGPATKWLTSPRTTRLLEEWRKEDGNTNHPDE